MNVDLLLDFDVVVPDHEGAVLTACDRSGFVAGLVFARVNGQHRSAMRLLGRGGPVASPDDDVALEGTGYDAGLHKPEAENGREWAGLDVPKTLGKLDDEVVVAREVDFALAGDDDVLVDLVEFDVEDLAPRSFAGGDEEVLSPALTPRVQCLVDIVDDDAMVIVHAGCGDLLAIVGERDVADPLLEDAPEDCF